MIGRKFTKQYEVMRDKNVEQTVKGKRVADVWDTFTIRASVQPLRPDEVLDESPGGERNRHGVRVYSNTRLLTGDQRTGLKADRIIINDEQFEVQTVEDWTQHSLRQKHYKSTCWRINSDTGGK